MEGEEGQEGEAEFDEGVDELIRDVEGARSVTEVDGMSSGQSAKSTTPIVPPVDKGKGKEKLHPSLPAKPPAPNAHASSSMQPGAGMTGRGQDRTTIGRVGR
jgi:hypothetical protein